MKPPKKFTQACELVKSFGLEEGYTARELNTVIGSIQALHFSELQAHWFLIFDALGTSDELDDESTALYQFAALMFMKREP